jgi:hypothetical protein
MFHLVAAAVAKREGGTSSAKAFEQIGQIVEAVCHDMNDLTLALHAAMAGKHAGGENNASLPFELARPYDEVGDAGFVFNGDEHDPRRRPGPLPDEHKTGNGETLTVAG